MRADLLDDGAPGFNVGLVGAVTDRFSRVIIASTAAEGKTVYELSAENHMAVSTCYRKVRRLVDQGFVVVERVVVTGTGRKFAVYRSVIRAATISLEGGGVRVEATVNPEAADKLRYRRPVPPRDPAPKAEVAHPGLVDGAS